MVFSSLLVEDQPEPAKLVPTAHSYSSAIIPFQQVAKEHNVPLNLPSIMRGSLAPTTSPCSPSQYLGDPLRHFSLQELDYGALYEVRTPHFYVEANKMPMARVRG